MTYAQLHQAMSRADWLTRKEREWRLKATSAPDETRRDKALKYADMYFAKLRQEIPT